jgi:hypothetical protein
MDENELDTPAEPAVETEFLVGVANAECADWQWWRMRGTSAKVERTYSENSQVVVINGSKVVAHFVGSHVAFIDMASFVAPTPPPEPDKTMPKRHGH